jgi:hypothetical protein
MFGYSKDKFDCLITHTEDNIAFVELADKDGEMSFMEIPKEDLEQSNITFKAGMLFEFILQQFFGWEKIKFVPIERKIYTQEEIDEKLKYYEEKYGDV